MKTSSVIKAELAGTEPLNLPELLRQLENDQRKSVQAMVRSFWKKYNAYLAEQERLVQMNIYESSVYAIGVRYPAGVDEVGRGPLAGPVMACAVILPENSMLEGVDDSKKLSAKTRERLFGVIQEKALSIGLGHVEAVEIDEIGIVRATHKAMEKAIKKLNPPADFMLVDGHATPIDIAQQGIIRGDSKSISIAAASIVAKVTRDKIMDKYHEMYPEYGFNTNKGYGSEKHIKAIRETGLSPIHRRSFTKQFV